MGSPRLTSIGPQAQDPATCDREFEENLAAHAKNFIRLQTCGHVTGHSGPRRMGSSRYDPPAVLNLLRAEPIQCHTTEVCVMAAKRRYDEDLRAIGQALEARDINVFVLKRVAENYAIEGMPEQTDSKVRQWLQRLRSGSRAKLLTLARADVERLSQTGKAKRSKWGQLTEFRKFEYLAHDRCLSRLPERSSY